MEPATTFEAHGNYVFQLQFTSDDKTLISCGMDGLVKLWSVPAWEHVRTFKGHENSVNTYSLAPDEKTLATGSTDNTVRLWSFPDGELLHTLQDRKKVVAAVRITPDGRYVAAASYGGRAAVWTLGGEPVVGIKVSKKNLSSVDVSPNGLMLATAGLGDDIWLHSLPDGALIGALSGHKIAVGSLRFMEVGKQLFSADYEGSVRFWDTTTWEVLREERQAGRSIVFAPDEQRVAFGMEARVQVRSMADWALQADIPISTKAVNGIAFSHNGKWLAVGAADKKIRVFELAGL